MGLTQEDAEGIIANVVRHGLTTGYVAKIYGVTRRRVQQLCKHYRDTGTIPRLEARGRKRYRSYPPSLKDEIVRVKLKFKCGAAVIGQYLRKKKGIRIDNNAVQKILTEKGMAKIEPNKHVRKKDWIRYERSHSLSAVHLDWHENVRKEWVCVVIDDASKAILAGGEYQRRSTEAVIELMNETIKRYGCIAIPREVIVDRGGEFHANTRDKNGNALHQFELYCKERGIGVILCGRNHPETNGKIEKWFDTYDKHRWEFGNFEEFIDWYNSVRPHMSLDFDNLETPMKAFYRKCQDIVLGNYMVMAEQAFGEGNNEAK